MSASQDLAREVERALGAVVDPELGEDVVSLGMARDVSVRADGLVSVTLALTVASCPLRGQLRADVERAVLAVHGVSGIDVAVGVMSKDERAALMSRARRAAQQRSAVSVQVPPSARVLAVASGKGGVGKSSVTVNLAVALAAEGFSVGVLDADVWGHSVPRLLGISGEVSARDKKMLPIDCPLPGLRGSLRVISMGFLADEDTAIMWRGLVLNRAVQHFLEDVAWGDIDYLLIDLPPGTGDVQMGLARMLPRAEVLIVTTPPVAAEKVAGRAADMARKGHLRVAGVIENMSAFVCDHGAEYPLFGKGGGERLAGEIGVPLVGSIPLHPDVARGGDSGDPPALADGVLGAVFAELAKRIVADVAPPVEMAGCTARLLGRVEEALG